MRKRLLVIMSLIAAFTIGSLTGLQGVSAHRNRHRHHHHNDVQHAQLFRDGSVSCTGADDTSRGGGEVIALPGVNEVHFKVKLRNAAPNVEYVLAISEEPDCANAQFYTAETTDDDGDATFFVTCATTAGEHNLLVNLSTSSPDRARNREVATKNFHVVVPAP